YFCDISEKFSCSTVSQSSYSEIFGIPVSLLGLLYFAAVGGLVLNGGKSVYRVVFTLTALSLVFSSYLTYVELFVLQTVCILCEASKVLMAAIAALTFRRS
ncbi:MAG: vitamin K epoxide reductase family protein, partial [Patescibacteria group bacterium]